MCMCLSTVMHMWKSEDSFGVGSSLPSCGFWVLAQVIRPGGVRLSCLSSPELFFSDIFSCDAGWPQAHDMASTSQVLELHAWMIQHRHHIPSAYFYFNWHIIIVHMSGDTGWHYNTVGHKCAYLSIQTLRCLHVGSIQNSFLLTWNILFQPQIS